MPRNLCLLAVVSFAALPACGGAAPDTSGTAPGDGATAPDSVPYLVEAETTAAASTVTAPSSTTGAPVVPDPQISAEMLSGLLATDQGRQLVVQAMADQTGLDQDAAACFVAEVDVDTLVALSDLARTGSDPTLLPAVAQADRQQALTTCGIPPDALQSSPRE